MAEEFAMRCCTSATRDIKTVAGRIEHEGLSFFAITLADLGKAVQKWLDSGIVDSSQYSAFAFKRRQGHDTGLPAFLWGFLSRVFDPVSGVLLEDPDVEAIYAIRQLTLFFSKIALPEESLAGNSQEGRGRKAVTPLRERRAMSEFLECESEVKYADSILDPAYMAEFKNMSALLFGDVFSKVDRDVYWDRLVPKHGPGAVADRLSSNDKWASRTWTRRLDRLFDGRSYLLPNRHFADEGADIDLLEPGAEIPVRVISVPKTLKSPRIIAIEPACMQYMQQAVLRSLLSAIREDGFLRRVVGFDDQEPNRLLARSGSLSGSLATLDLSEASDRVSNQHVLAMLEAWPHLSAAVQATRSRKADVPGHGVIRLAKFASMGSALCFPIEAMVFLTVIFLGIQRELSTTLSRHELIKLFGERVRVFGDDLIVPSEYVLSVVDELSAFGHKVNVSKSYWTGRFRESCGREYYDGHDVSIVKMRQVLPTRRQDVSGVIATVSLRNQLYWAGLWRSAAWLDRFLGKMLKHYPTVAPTSPLLGRESALGYEFQRLDPNLHSPLTKGFFVEAKSPQDHLEGSGALLKCLLRSNPSQWGLPSLFRVRRNAPLFDSLPSVDVEHLERSGRPEHVSILLGWRSPF